MHLAVVSQDKQPVTEEDLDLEAFFRDHHKRLVQSLCYLGAQPSEAEDGASDAWLVLLKAWDRVAPEARFSYLRTVAHRNITRNAVANRRQSTIAQDEAAADLDIGVSTEDNIIEADEALRLLKSLPPSQQSVLALFYDGFSTAEIAELLGYNLVAVRKNLSRGRNRLQSRFTDEADILEKTSGKVLTS